MTHELWLGCQNSYVESTSSNSSFSTLALNTVAVCDSDPLWSAKTTGGFRFRSCGHRLKAILMVQAAENRFGDDAVAVADPMAAGRSGETIV